MRRSKQISWAVVGVACAAALIVATSGVSPSRERQVEEILPRGDTDGLLRLVRDGLDPKTEVCTGYTTPDWADAFLFRFLPDSFFPHVCAAKSPLIIEAVHNANGPNARILVSELLQRGADGNSQSHAGDTPLIAAVDTADVDIARILLDHGAALNTSDARRAFHAALRSGNVPIIRLLLARGQNPNEPFTYDKNRTPLMLASESDPLTPMELLLSNKAEPNARDANGDTAISLVIAGVEGDSKKRKVRLLLQHGASLFIKNHDGVTAFDRLSFTQDYYKATGQTAKIPSTYPGPPPP